MVVIIQLVSSSKNKCGWNCNKIKEVLKFKNKHENTLFTNATNNHVWDIIIAFIEDLPKEKRTFMILTKPVAVYCGYNNTKLLLTYNQFWKEVRINRSSLSNALQGLKDAPFGFCIFRNPCPPALCEAIGSVTWKGGEYITGINDICTVKYTVPNSIQGWFPTKSGIGSTNIRYNYTSKLLEVCTSDPTWTSRNDYRYLSRDVHLPLVFYAQTRTGEKIFFHLPSSFQGLHLCDMYLRGSQKSVCHLKMTFREYYNPKYSLDITINLLPTNSRAEFTLFAGKHYELKQSTYFQRI